MWSIKRLVEEVCKEAEKADKSGDWTRTDELNAQLKRRDPYNDLFHYGCRHWPNCKEYGCGND